MRVSTECSGSPVAQLQLMYVQWTSLNDEIHGFIVGADAVAQTGSSFITRQSVSHSERAHTHTDSGGSATAAQRTMMVVYACVHI